MKVGVDTKAPLSKFYSQDVIDALTSGADNLSRWAIPQGQGDLLGAIQGDAARGRRRQRGVQRHQRRRRGQEGGRRDPRRLSSGEHQRTDEPARTRPCGHPTRRQDDRRPGGAARSRSARAREDRRTGYLLISPTAVIVFVMVVLPILWTVSLAFQQVRLLNLRHHRRHRGLQPRQLHGGAHLARVRRRPGHHAGLLRLRHRLRDRRSGCSPRSRCAAPFRGRGLVRACMLIPYVAPVVAATFVWKTMLNPQFGVVNHYGTTLLGWNEPIAFLSSAAAGVAVRHRPAREHRPC